MIQLVTHLKWRWKPSPRIRALIKLLFVLGFLVAATGNVRAMSIETLVFTGDAVPGGDETYRLFDALTLTADDDVFFEAVTTGSLGNANGGLYMATAPDAISAIAQRGQEPFAAAKSIPAGKYRVNASNSIIFDVRVGSSAGLYRHASDQSSPITATPEGGIPSGITGDVHRGFFGAGIGGIDLNDSGLAAFETDFGSSQNGIHSGLFADSSGAVLRNVAFADDPVPSIAGANFKDFYAVKVADNGSIFFSSSLIGDLVSDADDRSLWRDSDGTLTLLAREGDAAPGIDGRTLGQSGLVIGPNGKYLFRGDAESDTEAAITAYWIGDGGTAPMPILQSGSDPSLTSMTDQGDIVFSLISGMPTFSPSGDLYFTGSGNLVADNSPISGIWKWDETSQDITLLARQGEILPGENRGLFDLQIIDVNAQDQLAFNGTNSHWIRSANGDFTKVVSVSDVIDGKTIARLGYWDAVFSDSGSLAFIASFADGDGDFFPDEGIFLATPDPPGEGFIWTGDCGSSFWHDDCQAGEGGETITNWEDSSGQPTQFPPGGIVPIVDVVEINGAAVTLQQSPAGIQSLQATGSLVVQAPLHLVQDSGTQNLTIADDLTTDATLTLNSQKNVGDPFTDQWLSGTISGDAVNVAAGISKLVVGPTADFSISGGDKTLNTNLMLKGGSLALQEDGQLTIGNGAHLETEANGVYQIESGGIASAEAIVNAGTFVKSSELAGADAHVTIDAPFENRGGRIEVDTGRLTFTGRNTHDGGIYRVEAGATLEFIDEITEVTSVLNATGSGTLELTGGLFAVKEGATANFSLSGPSGLKLQDSAELKGLGIVTNHKNATIAGATISGEFINAQDADFIIDDRTYNMLPGTIRNLGRVEHQDSARLDIIDGGVLRNETGGQYTLLNNTKIMSFSGDGIFENAGGSLRVGTSAFATISAKFNMSNNGRLVIEQGSVLSIEGGGHHKESGVFEIMEADSGLFFYEGTQNFDGDFNIIGEGRLKIYDKFTITAGKLTSSLANDDARLELGMPGTARLGSPSIDATTGRFINQGNFFFYEGTLIGGQVTETGSENGFQNGRGLFSVRPVDRNAQRTIQNGVLRNFADGKVEQLGNIELLNGIILNDVGGLYDIVTGVIQSDDDTGAFHNRGGTLKKTGPANAYISVPFTMTGGTVLVKDGTLHMSSEAIFEDSGRIQVDHGAELEMAFYGDSSSLFKGDYEIAGQGIVTARRDLISEGKLNINMTGPGKMIFDGFQVGAFDDFISQGATLINQGNAQWRSGRFGAVENDGGHLEITGGGEFARHLRIELKNTGTIEHRADATVTFTDDGKLSNSGTYNLRGSLVGSADTEGQIENTIDGTFRLAAENTVRAFDGKFDNVGTVEVVDGSTLHLNGEVEQLLNPPLLNNWLTGGRWILHPGSLITLEDDSVRVDGNSGVVVMRGGGRLNAIPDATNSNGKNFENVGSFELRDSTTFNTSADFENNGSLVVDASSSLVVNGQFESNEGSRNRIHGTLTATDYDNDGGSFSGGGTINAQRFTSNGTLMPGNSPGQLTFNVNTFTLGADSVLEMELLGTTPADSYDQIVVNGAATLGGMLDVQLLPGVFALAGSTFDVLLAESITGQFDQLLFPLNRLGEPLLDISIADIEGMQAIRLTALETLGSRALLPGAGSTYRQDFDITLGPDGAAGAAFPQGWSAGVDGTFFSATSENFPPDDVVSGAYNVGNNADRALATGTTVNYGAGNELNELVVQLEVIQSKVQAWRVMADIETWAAGVGASDPFNVGFEVFLASGHGGVDLGMVQMSLAKPTDGMEIRDGNAAANRIRFDSGIVELEVDAGSFVDVQFKAHNFSNTANTIFGLDGVVVRALAPGDADANGVVDVADLLQLLGGQKFNQGVSDVTWAQGDFNADDQFDTGDLLTMLAFLTGKFPSDPYASETGTLIDVVADVIVNSTTGEVTIDLAGHTASAIILESAAEIFNGSQPEWNTTSQFPSTLPGELGNVLFTSTASGIDELGAVISTEFLGRDKDFYLNDLDFNILIASDGGTLTKGNVIVVPEPSTWILMIAGILLVGWRARKRTNTSPQRKSLLI